MGERLIPVEAMYLIFNFAMSNEFTKVDFDRLPFPSEYKLDYIRCVWGGAWVAGVCLGCAWVAVWLSLHRWLDGVGSLGGGTPG